MGHTSGGPDANGTITTPKTGPDSGLVRSCPNPFLPVLPRKSSRMLPRTIPYTVPSYPIKRPFQFRMPSRVPSCTPSCVPSFLPSRLPSRTHLSIEGYEIVAAVVLFSRLSGSK